MHIFKFYLVHTHPPHTYFITNRVKITKYKECIIIALNLFDLMCLWAKIFSAPNNVIWFQTLRFYRPEEWVKWGSGAYKNYKKSFKKSSHWWHWDIRRILILKPFFTYTCLYQYLFFLQVITFFVFVQVFCHLLHVQNIAGCSFKILEMIWLLFEQNILSFCLVFSYLEPL